jgi:protein-tyrosine phosphatase
MHLCRESDFHFVDIHSHILPGLDDGPRTLEESLRMCELYVAEGARAVIATPHMCTPHFTVTPRAVRSGARALSEACAARGMDLTVLPGADVRLEVELLDALDNEEVLTLGDTGRYLLLELPAQSVPRIEGLIVELRMRGIRPIVSHPERNMELWRKPHRLEELVGEGCLTQITADSFFGDFGDAARYTAERFLRDDLVHVVATDAHSFAGRRPRLKRVFDLLTYLAGARAAERILFRFPAAILRGEPIEEQSTKIEMET